MPELAGTILANIDDPNPAFWSGLLARVIVASMAANTRSAVTTEQTGVAIIGPAGLVVPGVPPDALKAAIEALCWNREWHGQQRLEHYRHLLVRRPVVRISSTEHLLITDVSLILDSITTYLELALVPDGGLGGIALHPSCFRKLLSEPFEQEVVDIFRSHGFRAGTVTDDGSWRIPAPIDLGRIAGPPPGEIDVLAVHPRGYGIVAECKVLALPFDAGRMRNLVSKLGDGDSEAFRSKLRRKVNWASGLGEALGHLDGTPLGMIVLDRYLPGLRAGGPEFVVPIEALDQALRQLVATG